MVFRLRRMSTGRQAARRNRGNPGGTCSSGPQREQRIHTIHSGPLQGAYQKPLFAQ
jgi:hypothetical protein